MVLAIFVLLFLIIPLFKYFLYKILTFFEPLRFNMQHVMIIGGSDGLGKEIVREIFMKGALITIVGRDPKKMNDIIDELDVNKQGDPLIRFIQVDITKIDTMVVEKII